MQTGFAPWYEKKQNCFRKSIFVYMLSVMKEFEEGKKHSFQKETLRLLPWMYFAIILIVQDQHTSLRMQMMTTSTTELI